MKKLLSILVLLLTFSSIVAQLEETKELVPFPKDSSKLAIKTTSWDSVAQIYIVQYSNPKDSAQLQLEMFQQIEARRTETAQYKALTYQAEKGIGRLTKIANQINSTRTYNTYIRDKMKPILKGDYVLTINAERIQCTVNNNLRIRETDGARRWNINPISPHEFTIKKTDSSIKYTVYKTSQQPEIWKMIDDGDSAVSKMILRRKT